MNAVPRFFIFDPVTAKSLSWHELVTIAENALLAVARFMSEEPAFTRSIDTYINSNTKKLYGMDGDVAKRLKNLRTMAIVKGYAKAKRVFQFLPPATLATFATIEGSEAPKRAFQLLPLTTYGGAVGTFCPLPSITSATLEGNGPGYFQHSSAATVIPPPVS